MTDRFDVAEAAGRCECGRSLRRHPPLPPVAPLRSWKAMKGDDEDSAMRRANALKAALVQPVIRRERATARKHRRPGEGLYGWS